MAVLTGNVARYAVTIDGVSQDFSVFRFAGEEGISRLFQFQLELACDDPDVDLASVIGKSCVLTFFDNDDNAERHVNGIINRVEFGEQRGRYTIYHMDLVPQIWTLSYRRNSRIFQNQTVQQTIAQVLDEAGIPSDQYRFALQGNYQPREYCVQYQESDLNFISRLMESEGIFYFFEHSEELHKLVAADSSSIHQHITGDAEITFHDAAGIAVESETITQFRFSEEIRPNRVTLKDFDFTRPALNLSSEQEVSADFSLEQYHFPAQFQEPSEGNRLARVRLEALQSLKQRGAGRSDCKRLVPGYTFSFIDHPRDSFNKEYVITAVRHSAAEPNVLEESAPEGEGSHYANEFQCIPVNVSFRPQFNARKPRIEGVQTAFVVGTHNEEIYTDEFGRVKIQFHWDRHGQNDENSSCWVRVSQLWAGSGWGAMFIPRVGHEVIVDFEEGDPDRPIVTGRVYHGTNRPPHDLPAERTKSTIKSNTTPDGGGCNELRFEDKKDHEEIYLYGQKDWLININNNKTQTIGNDESLQVGNNRTKNVGADETETIGENKTITVGKNHSESIGESASISIGENEQVNVGKDSTLSVGDDRSESIGKDLSTNIGKNASISVGENLSGSVGKDWTQDVSKNMTLDVGDNTHINIGKDLSINAGKKTIIEAADQLTLSCGQAKIILKKNGDIQIKGKNINVKGSGNVVIKGSKVAQN